MKKIEHSKDDDDSRLGDHLRAHASRFDASQELRDRIRAHLPVSRVRQASPGEAKSIGPQGFSWSSAATGLISGVALTLVISLSVGPQLGAIVLRPSLENALVSRHVYSMGQGHLFDVASSDRHTVKPWFQGKLDFSPPVLDLASAGFTLLGGRVDYIGGKPVAALAYRYKKHIVNVYIWPGIKSKSPEQSIRRGFNLVHWDDGAMQVWLVSDVEAVALNRFSQVWREEIREPATENH